MDTQAPLNVEMNADLVKAVNSALNPEEIRAAIVAEAQKQLAASDAARVAHDAEEKAAAERLEAAKKAAEEAPKTFKRVENIGGKDLTFEAASELELQTQIANAYRVAYSIAPQPTVQPVVEAAPDPAVLAAKAAEEAAAKAELELKFKRGEISTADYLEQSGAYEDFLTKKGLSIDALKATVEQTQTAQYEKSWAEATEEFLHSPAGADWPGGNRNREQLGMRLAAMGLTDAKDKVAALAQAYNEMKKTGAVFPNEQLEQQHQQQQTPEAKAAAEKAAADAAAAKVAADAAAAETARKAATERAAATSSSLFDRSSGVSDHIVNDKTKPAEFQIDPKATPVEIMDAWKKFQLANGRDPNAAFTETFAAKR